MNLLKDSLQDLDSAELRVLLDQRIGGPGQYHTRSEGPQELFLPLADQSCSVKVTFDDGRITAIEPGPAFDGIAWHRLLDEVEESVLRGPMRVGREFSFSLFKVTGSWRGRTCGLQILPAPDSAPQAPVEMAQHPFVLEFPVKSSSIEEITRHRWKRQYRCFTLLLNVLLAGRISLQARRDEHLWAVTPGLGKPQWVQPFYFAPLGEFLSDDYSPPASKPLEEMEPSSYYTCARGIDGSGLRVPSDLDDSICSYLNLPHHLRARFDRAAFWMGMASRQWYISMSISFTAVVSAIESLMPPEKYRPGPKFAQFVTRYVPGKEWGERLSEIYSLRSGILHGRTLMQIDEDVAFGWDPPWEAERGLHTEVMQVSGHVLRKWLKDPGRPE